MQNHTVKQKKESCYTAGSRRSLKIVVKLSCWPTAAAATTVDDGGGGRLPLFVLSPETTVAIVETVAFFLAVLTSQPVSAMHDH